MIGRPLYFMELSLGQFSSSSNVKVWNMVPAARGVGFAQVSLNFYSFCLYMVRSDHRELRRKVNIVVARDPFIDQVIGTASVVSYYCVLIALAIYYLVVSCQAVLPWTVCWPELAVSNILSHISYLISRIYIQEQNIACVDNSVNLTDISFQFENLECADQMVILAVFLNDIFSCKMLFVPM